MLVISDTTGLTALVGRSREVGMGGGVEPSGRSRVRPVEEGVEDGAGAEVLVVCVQEVLRMKRDCGRPLQ
jgi:hypothetical protein